MFLKDIIKECKKDVPAKIYAVEYEVTVDAEVVGELSYGPLYFTVWDIGEGYKTAQRRLCLRIEEKSLSAEDESALDAKGVKPYHWFEIANEFVPLASAFLRRRFVLGPVVRYKDKPRRFSLGMPGEYWFVDKAVVSGTTKLEELSQWLQLIEELDPAKEKPFMLAVKFYHQALQLIEKMPDMAYLNLVSAIETLSQDLDVSKPRLADIDKNLAGLIKRIPDEGLCIALEDAIIKREPFAQRKFVQFIEQNTVQSFWDDPDRPDWGRIDACDLGELLTRIYKQRSATLHRGEPFPPYIFLSPIGKDSEIPTDIEAFLDEEGTPKWTREDFIPYPHFFERLVNHVLKNFMQAHQIVPNS